MARIIPAISKKLKNNKVGDLLQNPEQKKSRFLCKYYIFG